MTQEIDIESALITNVLRLGCMTLEAFDDRIVVIEDEFRSGYECDVCNNKLISTVGGVDKSHIVCEDCDGRGERLVENPTDKSSVTARKCSGCSGKGVIVCPKCDGRGGDIVIQEAAARRPTTGQIVSVGDRVTRLERKQSVIYPSFSGHVFDLQATDLKGNEVVIVVRIMRESDVIAKVSGHLELRRVKRSVAESTAA